MRAVSADFSGGRAWAMVNQLRNFTISESVHIVF